MTRPRSSLVSVIDNPYYHCIGRCVRRALLCGDDPVTGKSFEHCKSWGRERLASLTEAFATELCTRAVMNNHQHLVARLSPERVLVWTDREVAQRWTRFFTGPVIIQRYLQEESLTAAEQAQVQATLNLWRARLADWSWFMPCLNQSLARQANAEDGCTGRFWEGRFKSQALFNAGALLTAMTYVDLNPIRAQLAESLATSEFTSVQQRMQTPEMSPAQVPRAAWPRLLPFAGHAEDIDALPFRWRDYLEPAASTGRCAVPGK